MTANSNRRDARKSWILPSALVSALVLIVCGVVLWNGPMTSGDKDGAQAPDDESQVATGDVAERMEKPEEEEAGYERITDQEYAKRAADSPDQVRVGRRFAQQPVVADKAAPGGLDWQALGPRPMTNEYWSGNDDASGRVASLLVDPVDPDIVYVAAVQGGVWKTVDAGLNWTPMTDHLSSLASGALCFHPANSNIIYYGTGEHHFSGDSFYGDGLFRSEDAAVTWTKIAAKTDVGSYISRVHVDANNTQLIYVTSDLGFVRSTDGGATWNVELGPSHCTDLAVDPMTPGVLYCAIRSSGLWKSTTYGATWTQLTTGLPTSDFRRINIAMAPSNPQVIYAAYASTGGDLYGMYKTTNGGATWTQLTNTPNYLGGQGNYDNCIIVDPNDEDVCYAGGTFPWTAGEDYGLVKTTDGGASWTDINRGLDGSQPHPDHHIFAWGNDGRLWLGNDGGVWFTDDGGQTYTNCNATLALTQIYSNALHPTNAGFVLGGTQDNGSARYDGVDAWPQVMGGDGGPCAVEWDSPNIYYTTYVLLYYLYKWDDGMYLGEVAGPWLGEPASWCNSPLVVDQNQANTLLTGTNRVWRTTDSADSWSAISGDLTGGGYLLALAVADGASNTIYSGSSDGQVYVTTDAVNWDLRSTGLPTEEIPDILLDPNDWQTAYLCTDRATGDRVFFTDDAGVTWQSVTGDLISGVRAMSLTVDFRPATPRLYLGTDYGVYTSLDQGTTWVKADQGLPNLAVYDISIDYANSLLIAGTHGRGVWRASLDVTVPTVALTAPVGGEVWFVGTDHDITWTASDDTGVDTVTLLLSYDGGASYPDIIAEGIANTGSYTWTLPGTAATNCRVKVVVTDAATNTASDESPADFDIDDETPVGDLPSATMLSQAHPNPFNPQTTIPFALARDTYARLQVYTVDGRLVATLIDQFMAAGPHQAVWKGTDDQGHAVASGNYLYTLTTTDGFQESGKMVLTK